MEIDAPQPMQRSSMNQSPSAPSGWRRRGMATRPKLSPDRITVCRPLPSKCRSGALPGDRAECPPQSYGRTGRQARCCVVVLAVFGVRMDGPAADRSELRSLPVGYSLTCWVGRRACRRYGRRRCRRRRWKHRAATTLAAVSASRGRRPGLSGHPCAPANTEKCRRCQGLGDLHRCGRTAAVVVRLLRRGAHADDVAGV